MATLLIQQPDGLFCVFDEEATSFPISNMGRRDLTVALFGMLPPSWVDNAIGAAARVGQLIEAAVADGARWAAARRRVCQVHGPDAAEWMLAVERRAAIHAFNHATPEQVEATIATLSPEGQAWMRDFEARGTR